MKYIYRYAVNEYNIHCKRAVAQRSSVYIMPVFGIGKAGGGVAEDLRTPNTPLCTAPTHSTACAVTGCCHWQTGRTHCPTERPCINRFRALSSNRIRPNIEGGKREHAKTHSSSSQQKFNGARSVTACTHTHTHSRQQLAVVATCFACQITQIDASPYRRHGRARQPEAHTIRFSTASHARC